MKAIDEFRTMAVLGAGTMGHGIAQVLAQAGYEVRLFDLREDLVLEGLRRIEAMLEKGVARGKLCEDDREAALSRIHLITDLEEACAQVDAVIEAAPEDLSIKRKIFEKVAEAAGEDCLLASNTSSLSIGEIAEGLPRPERFVGLHYFNPPPLMKLCEIVRGPLTSKETINRSLEFVLRQGKEPIVVRDSPGFASSRLGLALGLEAIRMVEEGVASPRDIDKAMKLGYGHPMGPLELTDHVGLDVRLSIARYLSMALNDARFQPPLLLERLVSEGKLGRKSGQGFYRWEEGRIAE